MRIILFKEEGCCNGNVYKSNQKDESRQHLLLWKKNAINFSVFTKCPDIVDHSIHNRRLLRWQCKKIQPDRQPPVKPSSLRTKCNFNLKHLQFWICFALTKCPDMLGPIPSLKLWPSAHSSFNFSTARSLCWRFFMFTTILPQVLHGSEKNHLSD